MRPGQYGPVELIQKEHARREGLLALNRSSSSSIPNFRDGRILDLWRDAFSDVWHRVRLVASLRLHQAFRRRLYALVFGTLRHSRGSPPSRWWRVTRTGEIAIIAGIGAVYPLDLWHSRREVSPPGPSPF